MRIELAPAYDLVCTQVYGASKEMSIFIGDHNSIENISRNDFEIAASEAGLGKKIAVSKFDSLADSFESALKEAVHEMYDIGFKDAKVLGDNILMSCGISI